MLNSCYLNIDNSCLSLYLCVRLQCCSAVTYLIINSCICKVKLVKVYERLLVKINFCNVLWRLIVSPYGTGMWGELMYKKLKCIIMLFGYLYVLKESYVL